MSVGCRLVLVLILTLSVVAAANAQPVGVDAITSVPEIAKDELTQGLMKALGDRFEFLGSEVGYARCQISSELAEWFVFVKVRAKGAGDLACAYTIDFDHPPQLKRDFPTLAKDHATYLIPMVIADRGTPRLLSPGRWGGAAYPHACIGDALVIPIHVSERRRNYSFEMVDKDKHEVVKNTFYSFAVQDSHDKIMERGLAKDGDTPVVRNGSADTIDLLAAWRTSFTNQPGTATHISLTAYLQLKRPGEFNLGGRLDERGMPEPEGIPYRVVASDQPVSVQLEYIGYKTWNKKDEKDRFGSGSSVIPHGTLTARVGDRTFVNGGTYKSFRKSEPRQGVVVAGPFKDVAAYSLKK